jgi:hypothetical protein
LGLAQTVLQLPQWFGFVCRLAQTPLLRSQQVPLAQQATLGELVEGQRFCVFPPHCLHAVLQLGR